MTTEQQALERIVLLSMEVAQKMLDEFETVVPFGVRAFADTDDVEMKCFQDEHPEASWDELLQTTIDELKKSVEEEDIFATAVVLSVESEDKMGIGLQIDTRRAPALFVYPYYKDDGMWVIDEPIQAEVLLAPRVFE